MGKKLGPDLFDPGELKPLPEAARRNRITVVLGAKGTGKSFWTKTDLASSLQSRESLYVWDSEDEYGGQIAGRRLVEAPHPEAMDWAKSAGAPPVSVRFNAAPRDQAHVAAAAAWLTPPSTVVFEEVHKVCPHGTPPEWFVNMVSTARHRACSLYLTSQRPARVPKDLVANADRVVIFRLGNEPDRRALFASLGDPRILTDTPDLELGQHLLIET